MENSKDTIGNDDTGKAGRVKIKKILSVFLCVIGGLALLIVLAFSVLTLWLTPERSTRLFNSYAGKYLKADVKAGEVDFRFWSTFPEFHLDIRDLNVISRAPGLHAASDSVLPSYTDSLLYLSRFSGDINPLALLGGRIKCGDVLFSDLKLNLVGVNDSVANYDIFPDRDTREAFRIPHFSFRSIRLEGEKKIRYYAVPTGAEMTARLSSARMERVKKPKDTYSLDLNGTFRFSLFRKMILKDFPFGFSGNTLVAFSPFRIRMEHYDVRLGNLRSNMNLSLELDSASRINSFHYVTEPVSLLRVLNGLPAELMPGILEGVSGDLMVSAGVSLTAPYYFSSSTLPSFTMDVSVPGSELDYTLSSGEIWRADRIRMAASLLFNGNSPENSYVDISEVDFSGEGVRVRAQGRVDDILSDPDVALRAELDGDIWHILEKIAVPGLEASGDLKIVADVGFRLSELKNEGVKSLRLKGNAEMRTFSYTDRNEGFSVWGENGGVDFTDRSRRGGPGGLDLKASVGNLFASTPDADVRLRQMNLGGTAILPSEGQGFRFETFGLSASCREMDVDSEADGSAVHAEDVRLGAARKGEGGRLSFLLDAAKFIYRDSGVSALLHNLHAGLSVIFAPAVPLSASAAQLRHDSIVAAHPYISEDSVARILATCGVPHTPENINIGIPRGLRSLLARWKGNVNFSVGGGVFDIAAYPDKVMMTGGRIYFDSDSVGLSKVGFRSGCSDISVSGSVANLRRLFNDGARTPVRIRLDAGIDTLDINSLAAAGKKVKTISPRRNMGTETAKKGKETEIVPAVLVPANIDAIIKMKARDTYYTNLHLYDLGTIIRVNRSAVCLDSLYAHSDFGAAYLNLLYSTRDIEDINMSVDLGLDSLDIVSLYNKFQSLQTMMPQLANLSGYVGLKGIASFDVFPDMNIDIPSVKAIIQARGWDLKLHQSPFIRDVTRHLFIRSDADIHIPAMNLKATVHDNLLQVNPFLFTFDRYTLQLMGENDFRGNLYYHVGVLDSPLPLKFGINITGTFDKYHVRFGGSHFKPHNAFREINLIEKKRISLVAEMKKYLNEFVDKAAVSVDGPGN